MSFDFYEVMKEKQELQDKKDYVAEAKELLMVKHGRPKNTKHWNQFDCSLINDNDIVALIDGDWLAFSNTAKEMERYIVVNINDVEIEFSGKEQLKEYCVDNDIDIKTLRETRKQRNHSKAAIFAKASIKNRIRNIIEETKATKVVIFVGNTGNHRSELPLPKLQSKTIDCWEYKGQRSSEWIPETLQEVKDWLLGNWLSHYAVGEESDDCITIAKHTLFKRGVKCYTVGVDKDYNCDHFGGLYIQSHQEKPEYFEDTEENRLGWLKAVEKFDKNGKKSGYKVYGHGDMFLCYQILSQDTADNYHCKTFLKHYGTLKSFSDKACGDYLMNFKTRKELWQGVYDLFVKHLPDSFEYEDCFGVVHKNVKPLQMLELYYKCAKMREHENHKPCVIEDRLKPLGVCF